MISVIAAATLTLTAPSAAQPVVTAHDIGRLSLHAGVCTTLGWESSRDRVIAGAEAWQRARPETNETENLAQLELGLADAQAELNALFEAFWSDRDAAAFARALMTRCDDAARDFPEVVNRATDTDARFAAAMTQIVQGVAPR